MIFRSFLYSFARLLGDASAVQKGRVGQRVTNRVIGKGLGRMFGGLSKWMR